MPEDNEETYTGKNAPYRSERRGVRRQKIRGRDRRITVRSVRREEPDLRKLARAVIQLAVAQAEAEAQAGAATGTGTGTGTEENTTARTDPRSSSDGGSR